MVGLFEAREALPAEIGKTCAICQTPIAAGEVAGRCPACDGPFHVECWNENGGCASYGCAQMPQTAKEAAVEPASYWGQEEKQCPRCQTTIKVAALRCRHCGEVFKDAKPISAAQYRAATARPTDAAKARKLAVLLFAAGLLPVSAPFALLLGGFWCLAGRRTTVAQLPAAYRILARIGLGAALVMTLVLLLVALFGGKAHAATTAAVHTPTGLGAAAHVAEVA